MEPNFYDKVLHKTNIKNVEHKYYHDYMQLKRKYNNFYSFSNLIND